MSQIKMAFCNNLIYNLIIEYICTAYLCTFAVPQICKTTNICKNDSTETMQCYISGSLKPKELYTVLIEIDYFVLKNILSVVVYSRVNSKFCSRSACFYNIPCRGVLQLIVLLFWKKHINTSVHSMSAFRD